MRGFEVVAGVIAAFFVIGIVFGVLLVVALPAYDRRRDARSVGAGGEYRRRPGRPGGYRPGDAAGWEEPPGLDGETPPPWPGRRG